MPSPSKDEEANRASPRASPEPKSPAQRDDEAQLEADDAPEDGEVSDNDEPESEAAPPLPSEPVPGSGPPLPTEPVPQQADDGWDCQWDPTSQAWYFLNRFTGKSQWENPRVPSDNAAASGSAAPLPPTDEAPAAGGYNPAIHGDYDPNAWYAKGSGVANDDVTYNAEPNITAEDIYASRVAFNRYTGSFQTDDAGPGRHSDESKSKRQMNAFFDVEAAANAHDGRSLRAERAHKKPSKSEVKAFKEKRRAKKEEKRRAWLRD